GGDRRPDCDIKVTRADRMKMFRYGCNRFAVSSLRGRTGQPRFILSIDCGFSATGEGRPALARNLRLPEGVHVVPGRDAVERGRFTRKLAIAVALSSTMLATPALVRNGAWYVGGDLGAMIVEDVSFDYGLT